MVKIHTYPLLHWFTDSMGTVIKSESYAWWHTAKSEPMQVKGDNMELLFYIVRGLLYGLFVIPTIAAFFLFMYGIFKFAFWIFDLLGIENPVIKIWSLIKSRK